MATIEMMMPKMGESVMEGTVLSWLKNVGDQVEEDESLLEVATDKVDTEIPATHSGVLKEILAQEGDVVEVGKPIAVIETEGEEQEESPDSGNAPQPETSEAVDEASKLLEDAVAQHSSSSETSTLPSSSESGRFYSPLVRNIAQKENISFEELESVPGTGKEGRVTKKDILAYLDKKQKGETPVSQPQPTPTSTNGQQRKAPEPMPVTVSGEDEIIEMDRMRKMIAERMVSSKAISPHVTSFVEADVTHMVRWRNKMKNTFKEREGQSLTFTPIIIEAVVKAIKDYPMINIQVDGDKYWNGRCSAFR